RFRGLRENDDAAYRLVESAHYADVSIARLVIFPLEIVLGEMDEAGGVGKRALRGDSRRLVNDQQVIVLVKDRKRRLRHGAESGAVRKCGGGAATHSSQQFAAAAGAATRAWLRL